MAKGFTKTQRDWFLKVYDNSCHFLLKNRKFCNSTNHVQIHHVVPKRYYVDHYGLDPNFALNGIAICAYNHIGLGYYGPLKWREAYVPVLHPDIAWAKARYNDNHGIFDLVFAEREKLIKDGKTYWNTNFDSVLEEITNDVIGHYIRHHPNDKYPLSNWQKENS